MNRKQLLAGLQQMQLGIAQVRAAIEAGDPDAVDDDASDAPTAETAQAREKREIALLLEFDRAAGAGLTRQQASAACLRHGFEPRTVGGWATARFLETRPDGLRYLTPTAASWLHERGVHVQHQQHDAQPTQLA